MLLLCSIFFLHIFIYFFDVIVLPTVCKKILINLMVDSIEGETSHGLISVNAIKNSNLHNQQLKCYSPNHGSGGGDINQLVKARKMGLLELSPNDEVEGEIIYSQHRLLHNINARKPTSGMSFLFVLEPRMLS